MVTADLRDKAVLVTDGAFFLCAGTSFVTAQTLVIDGGLIYGDEAHALKMEGRV